MGQEIAHHPILFGLLIVWLIVGSAVNVWSFYYQYGKINIVEIELSIVMAIIFPICGGLDIITNYLKKHQ